MSKAHVPRPRTDHPPALYKPLSPLPDFLRTYSARIYSIETNSSLACLHMPLLQVHSMTFALARMTENMAPALCGVSRTFGGFGVLCSSGRAPGAASGSSVCLMDSLLCYVCYAFVSCVACSRKDIGCATPFSA